MALRTTFASYADGLQPIPAALDAVLADVGKLGVIPCTASGTNAITLAPVAVVFPPTISAYQNGLAFSFRAAGAPTGSVTVGTSVGLLKYYKSDGTTQLGNAEITSGALCIAIYNSALDSGAGGFYLVGDGGIAAAPSNAEFLTGAASSGLTAERVVTDTTSITWDLATAGQAKAQRAALTGDVTASVNSNATTIANDAVTFAKMQNITTDRLLGRDTAASGDPEELTVGGGIEFTGTGGIQTSAFTGDVTKSAGGTATTIADDAVTYAKMQNVSATDMLLGRSTAGAGNVEEIACTAAGRALLDDAAASDQRTTLGLGTIATQSAASVAITGGSVTGITDIVVADGGTGLSSATAYAVLCGGTTGTGALQSIASVGTSGQSLISGGAATLPAMGWPANNRTYAETATTSTATTTIPADDTIPQNTEGTELLTAAITPRSASSRLRITVTVGLFTGSAALTTIFALFRDSTASAVYAMTQKVLATGDLGHVSFTYEEASTSTSATTYKLRVGPATAGTLYFNQTDASARLFGGTSKVTMVVEEVG